MYHLNEKYAMLGLMKPQEVGAGASVTGSFVDLQSRHSLSVALHMGAVAAGKSVKLELLTSQSADGSDAQVLEAMGYTGPEGGGDGCVQVFSRYVTPEMGRYLGTKVTNEGDAAVSAAVLLLADHVWYPEKDRQTDGEA